MTAGVDVDDPTTGDRIADPLDAQEARSARQSGTEIIRRGLSLSPAIKDGLGLTMLLAVLSTVGGAVVPIVIQVAIDSGLGRGGDIDRAAVMRWILLALALIAATAVCAYAMRVRLYVASERGLTQLRVEAFRHVHDLSMLTQNSERRGVLVSRVTSDADGPSVVVVAYRKATIALADEVVFIDEGRVADRGTHAELIARSDDYRLLVDAYDHAREAPTAGEVQP